MRYIISHIETIVTTYPGHPPLAPWLKQYYKQHPKLGSRDRRAISAAIYLYYRAASFYEKGSPALSIIFKEISQDSPLFLQQALKYYFLNGVVQPESIQLLWPLRLSVSMSLPSWLNSMRIPPRVFIRIRSEVTTVLQKLEQEKVSLKQINLPGNRTAACLSLPNGTAIDKLLPEKNYVVQDASSQRSVALVLHWLATLNEPAPKKVWDVCAGAGGKSIYLKDQLPPFDLLVSDIRPAILHNLQKRFSLYGLTAFRTHSLDMTHEATVKRVLADDLFDLVICDVPCSGSGTWARTPEQFHFFDPQKIHTFKWTQTQITAHAWPFVKSGGYLAYITCSVFEVENEQIVAELLQQPDATLIHQQLIDGIDIQADSMFVALIKKDRI